LSFKWWWSTILQISTKRTTTSDLKSLNTKRPRHKALEYEVLTLGEHTYVAVLNRLLQYQPSHLR
jgi:hypothetical protein